jgi:hypothetical protein
MELLAKWAPAAQGLAVIDLIKRLDTCELDGVTDLVGLLKTLRVTD